MKKLITEPTEIAQWRKLLHEAQSQSDVQLNENVESYLTFTLIRFTDQPHIAKSVLGLEFLENLERADSNHQLRLRDVADKCLLFSGLFPECAEHRRVSIGYFVELGKTAYYSLAELPEQDWNGPYLELGEKFVSMMDVLHAMRDFSQLQQPCLELIKAFELWQETGSKRAYKIIKQNIGSQSFLIHRKH